MLNEVSKDDHGDILTVEKERSNFSVKVDCLTNDDWDKIASEFSDLNAEQTAAYSSHHWKGRDSHLLLLKNGVSVAGARIALIRLPVIGKGLAFLRFGPFWRKGALAEDPAIYQAMIKALVDEYCVKRGNCLTILPRPHPEFLTQETAWLRELGFVKRREQDDPERFLVHTGLDQEMQLKSLAVKWRYNLRQSSNSALDVRIAEKPEEIEAFQALYVSMMERKQFSSTTPVHLTGQLIASLPDNIKPKLFVVYSGEELIAGATVGLFGDVAFYMFGATSAKALPLRAGYVLQWRIICWLHEHGYQWYDLGGASHEPGLRHFKKGLVGKAGQIITMEGEFDRWEGPVARLSADIIFKARQLRRRIRYGAKSERQA